MCAWAGDKISVYQSSLIVKYCLTGLLWGSNEILRVNCLAQSLAHWKLSVNIWLAGIWNLSLYLEDSLRMSPGKTIHPCPPSNLLFTLPTGTQGLGLAYQMPCLQSTASPCTTWGIYPVELGSSKNSLFARVAVEIISAQCPHQIFTVVGFGLWSCCVASLSSCSFLASSSPCFPEILWAISLPPPGLFLFCLNKPELVSDAYNQKLDQQN